MTAPTQAELLQYALVQVAAEAFLTDTNGQLRAGDDLLQALKFGNGHATRMTSSQASDFTAAWQVVDQKPDTGTGISGTLLKNRTTGELVVSFRSTEFIDDAARDTLATNTYEIKNAGFAWVKLADMEAWYAELRFDPGKPFSVTGSSGGHQATAFNVLYLGES